MEDFANLLHPDYGLKPHGSAPMSASSAPLDRASSRPKNGSNRPPSRSSTPDLGESLQDDLLFGGSAMRSSSGRSAFGSGGVDLLGGGGSVVYDDVFGGPPKFAPPSFPSASQSYDDIFRMPAKSSTSSKESSLPVFDDPLYDDDIFGGLPGIKNTGVVYDDVFSGASSNTPATFEDLLGGFATAESKERTTEDQQATYDSEAPHAAGESAFDELLPGFGGVEPVKPRSTESGKPAQGKSSGLANDSPADAPDDIFVVLNSDRPASSTSVPDFDPFEISARPPEGSSRNDFSNGFAAAFGNSSPPGPSEPVTSVNSVSTRRKDTPPGAPERSVNTVRDTSSPTPSNARLSSDGDSSRRRYSDNNHAKEQIEISSKPLPTSSAESTSTHSPSRRSRQVSREANSSSYRDKAEEPPKAVKSRTIDEFWISIEDVKLVTEPSAAPPPMRPPPVPRSKPGHISKRSADPRREVNRDSATNSHEFSPRHEAAGFSRTASPKVTLNDSASVFDELEEFASGGPQVPMPDEELTEGIAVATASAAAMKEAMERAKLKLRKEVQDRGREEREREARAARVREEQEKASESHEREEEMAYEKVTKERAREGEEGREAQGIPDREQIERDDNEREAAERHHKEREKEKEREREREREKDRIAVERATQEARARAAAEAWERAERIAAENRRRAERAAVERATTEARERAAAEARERAAAERAAAEARERTAQEARDRAAVERATAEARERAGADARERAAERAAVERAASEARARAERAAVQRATAEARERAAAERAAEARERAAAERAAAAAAASDRQPRDDNDLEAFFRSNSRPTSVPRQRSPTTDTSSDGRQTSRGFSSEGHWRSTPAAPSVRTVPSMTSMADDLASIFGGPPAAGAFQDVEGESAERRRARLERHQRTIERTAKALEEKNQRDLKGQREQAERHRAAETLDAEIRRWAAGKEGNLRALLSTLQYVLWPECGWQAVSLTDLITAAAVKKVYRKATLFVHPDKVQQKGATIQQKYIAEKVFDLLKEAWNKFNSEELF